MIIVKITILLVMITAVYTWCVKAYLSRNVAESLKYEMSGYTPKYKIILALLRSFSVIGIFASVIWFLFFR